MDQPHHGAAVALDELLPRVYDELRRLAGHYLRRERRGHTLRPTALVHEAYLRLLGQRAVDWSNRAQFFGLAAQMMRRVLLNHARSRRAGKRGRDGERITLSAVEPACLPRAVDLIALDAALDRLASLDERKARVVELKFFGGLTGDEIAELLHLSPATIEREWSFARAWLGDAVTGVSP